MTTIQTSDALEFLRSLADHSVDCIVTDPAYENLERHRKVGTTTRLKKAWFPVVSNAYYFPLCVEFRRVLAKHGTLVLFGDDDTQNDTAIPALKFAGFPVSKGSRQFRREVIWDKGSPGMGYGTRRQHERIIIQQWGKPWPWNANPDYDGGFSSIQVCKRPQRGSYPTEKPVDLLLCLIRQFSRPGDLVLDCFLGSGSTAEAAIREGRRFTGCDIEETAVQAARERLEGIDETWGKNSTS